MKYVVVAALAVVLILGGAGLYLHHEYKRDTAIGTIRAIATQNDMGILDSYVPDLVDKMHGEGASYDEVKHSVASMLLGAHSQQEKTAISVGLVMTVSKSR